MKVPTVRWGRTQRGVGTLQAGLYSVLTGCGFFLLGAVRTLHTGITAVARIVPTGECGLYPTGVVNCTQRWWGFGTVHTEVVGLGTVPTGDGDCNHSVCVIYTQRVWNVPTGGGDCPK